MPRVFEDFSDERNKSSCIHCGASLAVQPSTRDHTPSKVLLDRPFPVDLAVTPICAPCNNGFSSDEEYILVLLSAIFSDSCDPDGQVNERARKSLARSPALASLLKSQREEQLDLFGNSGVRWNPDIERVNRVILKNARAHLFYENGEPMFDEPEIISVRPLPAMSDAETAEFFFQSSLQPWCEVGSRWNFRVTEGDTFDSDGFLVVQPGVYRFRVEGGGLGIRSIIREYLATTVFW